MKTDAKTVSGLGRTVRRGLMGLALAAVIGLSGVGAAQAGDYPKYRSHGRDIMGHPLKGRHDNRGWNNRHDDRHHWNRRHVMIPHHYYGQPRVVYVQPRVVYAYPQQPGIGLYIR